MFLVAGTGAASPVATLSSQSVSMATLSMGSYVPGTTHKQYQATHIIALLIRRMYRLCTGYPPGREQEAGALDVTADVNIETAEVKGKA